MAIKRDRVNRVKGLVYLPMDGSRLYRGQRFTLEHVEEAPIGPEYNPSTESWEGEPLVKDPMLMKEPVNGDAVGDAVFDAMGGSRFHAVVIGYGDVAICSHVENGYSVLIDTGGSTYDALTPAEDVPVFDANLQGG